MPTHGNVRHMVMPLTGDCITRSWSRTTVVSMARQTFTHRRLSLFQGVLALRAWRYEGVLALTLRHEDGVEHAVGPMGCPLHQTVLVADGLEPVQWLQARLDV